MNEFLEKVSALKPIQKIGIVFGFAAFTVVVHYFLFYSSQDESYTIALRSRGKLEEKKNEYDGKLKTLELDQNINKKIDIMLNEKKGRLPDTIELESIVRELHRKAADSGIRIISFTPKKEEVQELYVEQPIAIELLGTYHETLNFLYGVSQSTRIINIHDIVVEEPEYKNQRVIVSSKLDIKVYRFKKDTDQFDKKKKKDQKAKGK